MRRVLAGLAGAALLVATAACGEAAGGAPPAPGVTSTAVLTGEEPTVPGSPPAVTVSGGGRSADLRPWTWRYTGGCADGAPSAQPDDLGSPEELLVAFPVPG